MMWWHRRKGHKITHSYRINMGHVFLPVQHIFHCSCTKTWVR